ncbi:MAG: hypothetical protein NXI31_25855 [bacterium]|nr:hypothetical protein [bacterium]
MTEVWFDPKQTSFAEVLAHGKRQNCARKIWTTTNAQFQTAKEQLGDDAMKLGDEPRPDKEPKYYLLQTPFKHVPMTAGQAARVNATLAPQPKTSFKRFLSPRQLRLIVMQRRDPKKNWPDAVNVPIAEAWARLPK